MPEETMTGGRPSIARLILVPSLITLAITILRLVGELQHWPRVLFNPAAGGGAAIIGITWLPLIFGPYFASKLAEAGDAPKSRGKVIGFAVLALVLFVLASFVAFAPVVKFPGKEVVGLVLMIGAGALVFPAWPALFKTLLAYAYAARIPVAIVMFFALGGNWGTHYDALPPEYTGPMDLWPKYLRIALLPQLIFWVVYTIIVGALFGGIRVAIERRSKPATEAPA